MVSASSNLAALVAGLESHVAEISERAPDGPLGLNVNGRRRHHPATCRRLLCTLLRRVVADLAAGASRAGENRTPTPRTFQNASRRPMGGRQ